ncbi:MAG: hypothetical protein PVF74_09440 [Anaerolineales bacterium]|jgi:hypothetical protein
MNKSSRIVASLLGIFAGFGGPEHGYFEILQGNVKPENLLINSIGPPCQPEEIWNLCEPAMTMIPSYLVTGIMASIIGIITMVWSVFFIDRKYGGQDLILLSIALLLFGGGIFPPLIGIIGGLVGTRINKPLTWWRTHLRGKPLRLLARMWPWPLVMFFVWLLGQFVIGYFFNDFLMSTSMLIPLLIIGLLILSVLTGIAKDIDQDDHPVILDSKEWSHYA